MRDFILAPDAAVLQSRMNKCYKVESKVKRLRSKRMKEEHNVLK